MTGDSESPAAERERTQTRAKSNVLRVGVLCDSTVLPAWQAACLEALATTGCAELELVVVNGKKTSWSEEVRRVYEYRHHLLLHPYWHRVSRPTAIDTSDWTERLKAIPQLTCRTTKKGRFSEYFASSDVAAIEGFRLDIIIRFGFGIIRGDILRSSRFGVWSFHHGDESRYRGVMPCFWELYHREEFIGAILQRLTDKLDGGVVLRKALFRRSGMSLGRNVDRVYFGSTRWPAEVCQDISAGKADYLNGAPATMLGPIFPLPSNRDTLIFANKVIGSALIDRLRAR